MGAMNTTGQPARPAVSERLQALVQYAREERGKAIPYTLTCRWRHAHRMPVTLNLWLAEGATMYVECPECHHVYLLLTRKGVVTTLDLGLAEPRPVPRVEE